MKSTVNPQDEPPPVRDLTPSPELRVPGMHSTLYYHATQWVHRFQAAAARRLPHHHLTTSTLRVLGYHRVSDDPDRMAVPVRKFQAQMEALVKSGVRPIRLDQARERLAADQPGAYVCVTFDDGYRDFAEHAVPVLEALGIPATVFVVTEVAEGAARLYWYDDPPPTLGWDELGELAQSELFSVGAHSRTHPALERVSDARAWQEISGSRADLEDRLGVPVETFAYPGGRHGEREINMVREAGYEVGITCMPGCNRVTSCPQAWRRLLVTGRDSQRLFEAKLTGVMDRPWGITRVPPAT